MSCIKHVYQGLIHHLFLTYRLLILTKTISNGIYSTTGEGSRQDPDKSFVGGKKSVICLQHGKNSSMNRLAVYSYLTRNTCGHIDSFGRLFMEPLLEKS